MGEDTEDLKSQITQGHMVIKHRTEDFDPGRSEEGCAKFSINIEVLPRSKHCVQYGRDFKRAAHKPESSRNSNCIHGKEDITRQMDVEHKTATSEVSRVWSRCQTEEPWKQGQLQERPTEEAHVGTRISEEEASHCREGEGQKCVYMGCAWCV